MSIDPKIAAAVIAEGARQVGSEDDTEAERTRVVVVTVLKTIDSWVDSSAKALAAEAAHHAALNTIRASIRNWIKTGGASSDAADTLHDALLKQHETSRNLDAARDIDYRRQELFRAAYEQFNDLVRDANAAPDANDAHPPHPTDR